MKKLFICFGFLFLSLAASLQAQPDPRDSIILESKTVAPQAGSGGIVRLKVYITNKDSLTGITFAWGERTTSGGAYMTLSYPRTFAGVVEPLTNTLSFTRVVNLHPYDGSSPDSCKIFAGHNPGDPATIEPPNSARKAIWELKFDTVFNNAGTIEFDTVRVADNTVFVNTVPTDLPVNFIKSVVTVVTNPMKGDLNLDGEVRPADVVLELYCVYLGQVPPAGMAACDVNCDGQVSPADVAVFLNYKFVTLMWPC